MPIRVTCQCGQSFAAPDHLAGKRVKCPKCSQPIAIPAAAAAAPAQTPRTAPAKQPAAAQPARPAAPAADPFGDLGAMASGPPRDIFSEAGLKQAAAGTTPCPSCGKAMDAMAVLCVNCGFHRQLGKKLSGVAAPVGVGGGHGDGGTAQMLLSRAARAIDDDKEEEIKTRSQGLPAWVYALLLLGCFVVAGIFMQAGPAMGFIWTARLGWFACSVGELIYFFMIVSHGFKRSAMEGLLVLLCPFYVCYYAYVNWKEIGTQFAMMMSFWGYGVVCSFLYWIGVGVAAASGAFEKEEARVIWETAQQLLT